MKGLLSFSIVTGIGVSAAEEARTSSSSVNQRLAGMMTKDLEVATKIFVQERFGKITMTKNPSSGGRRTLRNHSAEATSGKSGKMAGKSGKSEFQESYEEVFFLLPAACPNKCISSHVSTYDEMIDNIKVCQVDEPSQMWRVISDGSYIMIESYNNPGMCISVDYEANDDEAMVAETCLDGVLMLKDCNSVYGVEWYFTGGQLINSFCWAAGLSSMMTVNLEGKDSYTCQKDVAVYGAIEEPLLKADTFMFVNRLPEAPFYISDVEDALDQASPAKDSNDKPKPKPKEVVVHFEGDN